MHYKWTSSGFGYNFEACPQCLFAAGQNSEGAYSSPQVWGSLLIVEGYATFRSYYRDYRKTVLKSDRDWERKNVFNYSGFSQQELVNHRARLIPLTSDVVAARKYQNVVVGLIKPFGVFGMGNSPDAHIPNDGYCSPQVYQVNREASINEKSPVHVKYALQTHRPSVLRKEPNGVIIGQVAGAEILNEDAQKYYQHLQKQVVAQSI